MSKVYYCSFTIQSTVNYGDSIRQLRNGKRIKIEVESNSEIPYLNKNQKRELKVLQSKIITTGKVPKMSRWQKKNLLQLFPAKAQKIQGESRIKLELKITFYSTIFYSFSLP